MDKHETKLSHYWDQDHKKREDSLSLANISPTLETDRIMEEIEDDGTVDFLAAQAKASYIDAASETALASMIQTSMHEEFQREKVERLAADSIRNMQRLYEESKSKIEKFGKDIIRTIAAEYIIRHNKEVGEMFKTDYSMWNPESKLKLLDTKIGYDDWVMYDHSYVAYKPLKAEGLFAEEPKIVLFRIPFNFLPSLYNWERTKDEIASELENKALFSNMHFRRLDASISVNIGNIEIDTEALFKNFYLARTAGTGALRIPFIIKGNSARQSINFTVRVEIEKAKLFSNNQDILLSKLVHLSKASAKKVITDINAVLDNLTTLSAAQRHVNESLSKL